MVILQLLERSMITSCYARTMSRTHELKIGPEYFSAVSEGTERFELRRDDRGSCIGDVLLLREWDENGYSGRTVTCDVKYILRGHTGLDDDYVIMGIGLRL